MSLPIQRRGVLLLAVILSTGLLAPVHTAVGQFKLVHGPSRIHIGQTVNFYVTIDASIRFDGAYLAIPTDWELEHVTLISALNRASDVSFRPLEASSNRYQLLPARRLTGQEEFILRLSIGDLTGPFSFRITPFTLITSGFESRMVLYDGLSLRQDVRINPERETPENRVLERTEENSSLLVVSELDLAATTAFTAEFWIKTASLNAVVLSTWDGDDESSYPLELVLDAAGHVVFYRGVPGEHRSMRSAEPVADGSWHHVSVTHDGDSRWSRMYVDGHSSDSLFHLNPLPFQRAEPLVLGRRRGDVEDDDSDVDSFIGFIDEIRIWNVARDGQSVRTAMRQHLVSQEGTVDVLSFDNEDTRFLEGSKEEASIALSDLSFYEPIRDLEVSLDVASVLLVWRGVDPNATGFGVERSIDGVNYDELERIDSGLGSVVEGGNSLIRYRDATILGGVAYYRIRQFFVDGMETVSAAVKIGMGVEDKDTSGTITGNFPNPFNPSTTITYLLREAQHIQVSVWDLSGQMVAMLVDGRQEQGEHQVQFEAIDLPTGTYFVRMRTKEGVQTRQIILMK